MKIRSISILVVVMILLTLGASSVFAAPKPVKIFVNESEVIFPKNATKPFIKNGVVIAPIRYVAEKLGATVDYRNNAVEIKRGSDVMVCTLGKKKAQFNEIYIELDAAPKRCKGNICGPVRSIAKALGAEVTWNQIDRTVIITTH